MQQHHTITMVMSKLACRISHETINTLEGRWYPCRCCDGRKCYLFVPFFILRYHRIFVSHILKMAHVSLPMATGANVLSAKQHQENKSAHIFSFALERMNRGL